MELLLFLAWSQHLPLPQGSGGLRNRGGETQSNLGWNKVKEPSGAEETKTLFFHRVRHRCWGRWWRVWQSLRRTGCGALEYGEKEPLRTSAALQRHLSASQGHGNAGTERAHTRQRLVPGTLSPLKSLVSAADPGQQQPPELWPQPEPPEC